MSSSSQKSVASSTLKPAAELARASGVRFPNESAEYRRAREALLAEETGLRRHTSASPSSAARCRRAARSKELCLRGRARARLVRRPVRR
jgi:hypothetical protein